MKTTIYVWDDLRGFMHMIQVTLSYSPVTCRAYATTLGEFAGYLSQIGVRTVAEIERRHFRRFLASRYASRKKKVNNVQIAAFQLFFQYLARKGRVPHEMVSHTKALMAAKVPQRLGTAPTEDQMRVLLEDPPFANNFLGQRDRAILEVLYGTGIRVSELANITREDLDLAGKRILILGKGKVERLAIFGKKAEKALAGYLRRRKKHLRGRTGDPDFLFRNARKGPLSVRSVRRILQERCRVCGLPEMNPHLLRHCFAVHLRLRGASTVYIQHLLGHAKLVTTTIYLQKMAGHDSLNLMRAAMEHHPRDMTDEQRKEALEKADSEPIP